MKYITEVSSISKCEHSRSVCCNVPSGHGSQESDNPTHYRYSILHFNRPWELKVYYCLQFFKFCVVLFYFVQHLMEPAGLGVKDIGRSGSKEAGSGKFYAHYTFIYVLLPSYSRCLLLGALSACIPLRTHEHLCCIGVFTSYNNTL